MTTLAADAVRTHEIGGVQEYPVIASDIIYSGAAVGLVKATGHARPLTAVDKFVGFAEARADNAAGAAAAINVRVKRRGQMKLSVTGVAITDYWQPVYATDDNAFSLSPVGGVFVGFVSRYESSGVAVVAYDVENFADPNAGYLWETVSANKTLDAEDSGKGFWIDTDTVVITLPAVAGLAGIRLMNGGAYGAVGWAVSPNSADMIEGPDITAADDKDLTNTKATAQRGDFLDLQIGDANGWVVTKKRGTFVRET